MNEAEFSTDNKSNIEKKEKVDLALEKEFMRIEHFNNALLHLRKNMIKHSVYFETDKSEKKKKL